ncbi:MAG: cell division protein FtsZ [Nitrospira sp.]|nr:cell division protein FtsZ [Nitrospira sp.]MDD9860464.1 cell division protein FtsZ [Nitrospira sp.]
MLALQQDEISPIRIKVIGIGGAGCNAVETMMAAKLVGVEFVVANTDLQSLTRSSATHRIQLGPERTKGLGAGARPEIGKEAAVESEGELREALQGVDMVFVTAGMGGGTGTGGAPVVASLARECGILTVGVVTKPFQYEGHRRMDHAEEGLRELRRHVDSLLIIPNQKLLGFVEKSTPLLEAFKVADDILRQAIKGISDVITTSGVVNVDFADVRTIMCYTGRAVMGMGMAKGANRAREAAQQAMASPLLEEGGIEGGKGLLLNITGGPNLTLHEVDEASTIAEEAADDQANIIVGQVIDQTLTDEVIVTVIATGFDQQQEPGAALRAKLKPFGARVGQDRNGISAPRPPQPVLTTVDLDRPAFERRGKANGTAVERGNVLMDADWDVPTFLRRKGT